MCWVRVTGGGPSPNDKPEESKGCFLKCYLCLAQRRQEGRKGIYKRRSVWWGEIHGAEKGGATGTCDPGRTGHLGGNTLGCCGFLCVFFVLNQRQHQVRIQKPFSLNLITEGDNYLCRSLQKFGGWGVLLLISL